MFDEIPKEINLESVIIQLMQHMFQQYLILVVPLALLGVRQVMLSTRFLANFK